jgi:hypothetical protein
LENASMKIQDAFAWQVSVCVLLSNGWGSDNSYFLEWMGPNKVWDAVGRMDRHLQSAIWGGGVPRAPCSSNIHPSTWFTNIKDPWLKGYMQSDYGNGFGRWRKHLGKVCSLFLLVSRWSHYWKSY